MNLDLKQCGTKTDHMVAAEMAARRIPGLALGVIRDGILIKASGYGLADLEHDVPVTPDTVFDLASLTKVFTAAGVLLLVQDGKISLDDPLHLYISDCPSAWTGISLRHLLTHTAGLDDRFEGSSGGRGFREYPTANLLAGARQTPTIATPGTCCRYSDQGYFLLGLVIERAGGRTFREFLTQRIFQPLGMSSTVVLDQWQILKHRAEGYTNRDGRLAHNRRTFQVELPSYLGVYSSINDLAKWNTALDTDVLLTRSTLDRMATPAPLNDGSWAFRSEGLKTYHSGLGWCLGEHGGRKTMHHGGVTGTYFLRFSDDRLTVIILTNLMWDAGSDPDFLARAIADIYLCESI